MALINYDKIYPENVEVWNKIGRKSRSRELHHVWLRFTGLFLCCLEGFSDEKRGHEDDAKRIKYLREQKLKRKGEVLQNHVEGFGCIERKFERCLVCKMPILSENPEYKDRLDIFKKSATEEKINAAVR